MHPGYEVSSLSRQQTTSVARSAHRSVTWPCCTGPSTPRRWTVTSAVRPSTLLPSGKGSTANTVCGEGSYKHASTTNTHHQAQTKTHTYKQKQNKRVGVDKMVP